MKLAERAGELIERKVAGAQIATLLIALRGRLLAIPESLPRQLENKNPHEMRSILLEAIHDALRELSRLPSTLSASRRFKSPRKFPLGGPAATRPRRRPTSQKGAPLARGAGGDDVHGIPMNDEAKQRKEEREIAIGNCFLKELRCDHTFVRHGEDDGEPDLIYLITGSTVGVEILAPYYSNDQARIENQIRQGKLKSSAQTQGLRGGIKVPIPNNQDEVITSSAQRDLNKKCLKRYAGNEVWLFLYLEAPLLEMSEFKELVARISIPRHCFAQIYFGFTNYGEGGKLVVERQC